MKKRWILGVMSFLLMMTAAVWAGAEELTCNYGGVTFTYEVTKDPYSGETYASIISFSPVKDLTVPAEVDGIPVKVIQTNTQKDVNLQENREILETLTLEEGIQEIGNGAFYGFENLKSAYLPDSLNKIGMQAFQYCISLREIRFPEEFATSGLGMNAFASVPMEDIVLPDGTSLLERGYRMADNLLLEYMLNPYFSTYSDGWVYQRMEDETAAVIFLNRSRAGMEDEKVIEVPSQINGLPVSVIMGESFAFDTVLEKIILPEGLRVIETGAFMQCSSLREVNLPDSLERIGNRAFAGVAAEGITLPEGLRDKMQNVFWHCTAIQTDSTGNWMYGLLQDGTAVITKILSKEEKLTLPSEVDGYKVTMIASVKENIRDSGGNHYAKQIVIPEGVTILGYHAFDNFSELTKITLPKGLSVVGDYALVDCKKLSGIQLPDSVTEIGDYAFTFCEKLSSIKLPKNLQKLGSYAFNSTNIKQITLPDTVTEVASYAFTRSPVTTLNLSKGMTEIPERMCYKATNLKTVKIPAGITSIGAEAFYDCKNLSGVTLPEGLLSIGDSAFRGLTEEVQSQYLNFSGKKTIYSLKSIKLPASLQSIGEYAFAASDALTTVTFAKKSELQEIGKNAFGLCVNLKEITLPDMLQRVGSNAFVNCLHLMKVNLGNSVVQIEEEAFLHDTAMTSLTVPDTLTDIGERLLEDHGEKLVVTCGEGSAMESYLTKNYPEITVKYPKTKK